MVLIIKASKSSDKSVDKLLKKLIKAKEAYYNTEYPIMTDEDFDALEEQLRKIDPKNPYFKKIGAPISKENVVLPVPMMSLNKIKTKSDVNKWVSGFDKSSTFVVSDKLDGVSVLLVYKNGKPIASYTRGDGTVGGDISYLIPHFNIPKSTSIIKDMTLRGELVMSHSNFDKWSSTFKNSRNMVAGISNRKDIHPGIKDVDVVIYDMVKPRLKPTDAYSKLKKMGFKLVSFSVFEAHELGNLSDHYAARKKRSKYSIDGLVIHHNDIHPVAKDENPSYATAFKENEKPTEATVTHVEWSLSKDGLLKPRVYIKPVRLAGVTVSKITGFNFKFIKDNKIGKGTKLGIVRSGEVIPHIVTVYKSTKADLPDVPYNLTKSGVDAVVKNASNNDEVKVRRIMHFFDSLGTDFIRGGMVQKLVDAGYDSIESILNMSLKDFKKLEGMGDTSAQKVYNAIHESIDGAPLHSVMKASGVFGRNFGETRIASILKKHPDILKVVPKVHDISNISGISHDSALHFFDKLPKFKKWLAKTPITTTLPKAKKAVKGKLTGKTFVWTGFRDIEMENKVEKLGGTVGSSVKNKDTILIVKDLNSSSSKAQKARELGITILDKAGFNRWLSNKSA